MKNKLLSIGALTFIAIAPLTVISCSTNHEANAEINNVVPKGFLSDDYITFIDDELKLDSSRIISDLSYEFSLDNQFSSEFSTTFKESIEQLDSKIINFHIESNDGTIIIAIDARNQNDPSTWDVEVKFVDEFREIHSVPKSEFEEDFLTNNASLTKRMSDVYKWHIKYAYDNNYIIMSRFNYLDVGESWWFEYMDRKMESVTFYTNHTKEEYIQFVQDGGLSIIDYHDPMFKDVFLDEGNFRMDEFLRIQMIIYSHHDMVEILKIDSVELKNYNDYSYIELGLSLKSDNTVKQIVIGKVNYRRYSEDLE